MKRLLIGLLAVGGLLFATGGVASATTSATIIAKPTAVNLDKTVGACSQYDTLAAPASCGVFGGAAGHSGWPLASDPGYLLVKFPTPATAVTGYSVACVPPKVTQGGPSGATPVPITLNTMVSTFLVNPDKTSANSDIDYDNTAGTTTLYVGPSAIANANTLPPMICTVTATNVSGATVGKPSSYATAPAQSSYCGSAVNSAASDYTVPATGAEQGPLYSVGSGDLTPITANITAPVSGGYVAGKQTSNVFTAVVADVSAIVPGTPPLIYCSTGPTYQPQLIVNEKTIFAPTVSAIAAVTTGAASGQHAAEIKVAGLGVNAPLNSSAQLNAAPGAQVLYAYDAYDFKVKAGSTGCPSTTKFTCITNTAAIISGGAPNIAGVGYIAIIQTDGATVLPGKPLVSVPATITFEKTGAANSAPPSVFGLSYAGASLTLYLGTPLCTYAGQSAGCDWADSATSGVTGPVVATVTASGNVIQGINDSYVATTTQAAGHTCSATTGYDGGYRPSPINPATGLGTCLPYGYLTASTLGTAHANFSVTGATDCWPATPYVAGIGSPSYPAAATFNTLLSRFIGKGGVAPASAGGGGCTYTGYNASDPNLGAPVALALWSAF